MKVEFKLNGKKYEINEPTIADYYKIQDHLILLETTEARLQVTHLLSGAPIEELREVPSKHFDHLWSDILQGPLDLSVQDRPFEKNFVIDGTFFAFLDITRLKTGELSDMDTLRATPGNDKLLHRMMAILYRPATMISENWVIVEPYSMEGFDHRAELFKEKMNVKTVLGAINFFFHITRYSFESTMDSLVKTSETPEEKETILLTKDLMLESLEAGLNSSTLSQGTMRSEWKKLLESLSPLLLTTSHTERTRQKEKRWRMTSLFEKWKTKN